MNIKQYIKLGLVLISGLILANCASNGGLTPIDQVPMYGGMDRSANPKLAAGDKALIEQTVEQFGSHVAASNAFVDRAFRLKSKGDRIGAMRRFNQAWLINKDNPETYYGFGSVLYDRGDNCGAMDVMNKSLELNWGKREYNRQAFLAELGMITSLCADTDGHEKWGSKEHLIEQSNQLFLQAQAIVPTAYLYDKWWQALYWRGDYKKAWEKVFLMRAEGGRHYPRYLRLLEEKMPEPKQ